jgi:outer membrane protein assembly factor BamA
MAKLTRYTVVGVISVLMCVVLFGKALGQNNYQLIVKAIDKDRVFTTASPAIKTTFLNASDCSKYLDQLPSLLQSQGYISASIDSVDVVDNQTVIYLFTGEQYKSLELNVQHTNKNFLRQMGWDETASKNKAFHFSDYQKMSERLLNYFENNGYPFAKVFLDSIDIIGNKIKAVLNVDQGFPYRIDSLRMYGPAKISRNFIHRYLNIERGSAYSKEKLGKIDQRLLELPYLQQSQPWDVTMLNTGGLVNLYLQQKKSNQINVLAGFLPSNQQLGGKLLLTVDANLQLQNAFGGGENFGLIWQQIQPKSPKLHLQFTQPYLFNSPFGVDFLFDLHKRDSSFLNINAQLGLLFMASPNKTGKVILQSQQTNLLQVDTLSVKVSKRLPDIADVSSLNVGINYDVVNTNYRFNPGKGSEYSIFLSFGNKTIKKNNTVTQLKDASFNYSNLYDSIKLKTYQLRLNAKGAHYFKTGKQTVLKTAVNAGWYESPSYFRNKLFQIGGYRLLRGFDEESIFTNRYAVGTVEYRYLIGLNSNFFVFSDFGVSANSIIKKSNTYLGAGGGLSFATKGGIFNISYAVGKRNDLNFDIKQSKIHFGYVSIF